MKQLMHYTLSALIALTLILGTSLSASAKQAQLLLLPTRIVLEKNDRFVTITVKNRGDATGSYRIAVEDMLMPENGPIRELKSGETDPYSAKDMIRISPRQMTLAPEESQNIRLMVRKPRDLADGEYRSHLRVTLVNDNVEEDEKSDQPKDNFVIAVKPRLSLVIPVIIRHGKTDYSVNIEQLNLHKTSQPTLDIGFTRTGNRSSMGDIRVIYIKPDGKEAVLKELPGVAIYRSVANRQLSIPLEMPKGVSLGSGKIRVTYTTQKEEGSTVLASKELQL